MEELIKIELRPVTDRWGEDRYFSLEEIKRGIVYFCKKISKVGSRRYSNDELRLDIAELNEYYQYKLQYEENKYRSMCSRYVEKMQIVKQSKKDKNKKLSNF